MVIYYSLFVHVYSGKNIKRFLTSKGYCLQMLVNKYSMLMQCYMYYCVCTYPAFQQIVHHLEIKTIKAIDRKGYCKITMHNKLTKYIVIHNKQVKVYLTSYVMQTNQ